MKSSAELYIGDSLTLTATVKGNSKAVSWSSSNSSIASVSSNGAVKTVAAGTAVITASANGLKANCTITVLSSSITLNKTSANLYVGDTLTLTATVKGKTSAVTWSSSNTSVATVSTNGIITAKSAGNTIITGAANGKPASCVVTVKQLEDGTIIYNGHTYVRYEGNSDYAYVVSFCASKGGHLATITSSGEQNAIMELVSGRSTAYYIGALKSGDNWKWITGEAWGGFTHWSSGEPNQENPPEEYVIMKPNGYWYDHNINGIYKDEVQGWILEYDYIH